MWGKTSAWIRAAWMVSAYLIVVLALYAWKPQFTNASVPVRGIADPVVALQMARSADEVDDVLSDAPSADREVMRIKQYIDFALIPGYMMLAIAVAENFAKERKWMPVMRLAELLTVVAAIADIRENLLILRIVDTSLSETSSDLLGQLHSVSVAKWALLAVTLILLGAAVMFSAAGKWRLVGTLGVVGASLSLAGLKQNAFLTWGGVVMVTALLLMAATLKLLTHESAT